jgi:hypothetical protein
MEVNGQLQAIAALTPGIGLPVPIGEEAGWAPEPVWTLWRRGKCLAPQEQRELLISCGADLSARAHD